MRGIKSKPAKILFYNEESSDAHVNC